MRAILLPIIYSLTDLYPDELRREGAYFALARAVGRDWNQLPSAAAAAGTLHKFSKPDRASHDALRTSLRMRAYLCTEVMTVLQETICPGCGLRMPARTNTTTSRGYYNVSDECWDLYTEVLGSEYSDAVLFGQVHQLTVDSYAAQHAGGPHPDKSLDVHLFGLYLALEKGIRSPNIPPLFQRLVAAIEVWPHYEPPTERAALTIFDVAFCDSTEDHIRVVKEWSQAVWESWSNYHTEVAALVNHCLKMEAQ